MAFTKKNEEAVSPVIGVILMVAVTVILAAVIAAFVFGMAGNLQKSKSVAATANHHGNTITVTYQGGPDAANVNGLRVNLGGTTNVVLSYTVGSTVDQGSVTGTNNHIVVTATFTDGSQQVILDTYV